jgi:hypothetical protein
MGSINFGNPKKNQAEELRMQPANAITTGVAKNQDGDRVGVFASSVSNYALVAQSGQGIAFWAVSPSFPAASIEGGIDVLGDVKIASPSNTPAKLLLNGNDLFAQITTLQAQINALQNQLNSSFLTANGRSTHTPPIRPILTAGQIGRDGNTGFFKIGLDFNGIQSAGRKGCLVINLSTGERQTIGTSDHELVFDCFPNNTLVFLYSSLEWGPKDDFDTTGYLWSNPVQVTAS